MFSPESTDVEIAEMIAEILAKGFDDSTRKTARGYFEERFSPKVVGGKLIACYRDLIQSDDSFTTEKRNFKRVVRCS